MFLGALGRLAAPTTAMLVTVGVAGSAEQRAVDGSERILTPAQFEQRLLYRTNLRRAAVGCGPVRLSPALSLAAARHSVRMATRQVMSHQLPGEARLGVRVENAGYHGWLRVAENIAWADGHSPNRIFMLWIDSPGHRAHIQDCSLGEIGIGVRYAGGRVWATQDFGRR